MEALKTRQISSREEYPVVNCWIVTFGDRARHGSLSGKNGL